MKLTSALGLSAGTLAAILAVSAPASAAPVVLPNPGNCGTVTGTNCLVFEDFKVYSLALLNFQAGFPLKVKAGDPFGVSTNGIDLQNALVVTTGVGGQGSINTDLVGGGLVDNAYDNPNLGGGLGNFVMASGNQGAQGANIPNNSTATWDIDVGALNTYLNGGQLQFFFNLNQTGSQQSTYLNSPQDALGWLAVTVSDSTGLHAPLTAYLDGNACTGSIGVPGSTACDPTQSVAQNISPGNSDILPAGAHDEWAYIHGKICVDASGAVIGFGACVGPGTTLDQNLGANLAAFGLTSDLVSMWLASGFYDKMSVDLRMAAQTNGYEQLIILAGPQIVIPEPVTIGLFGAGLVGVGLIRRRRKKA